MLSLPGIAIAAGAVAGASAPAPLAAANNAANAFGVAAPVISVRHVRRPRNSYGSVGVIGHEPWGGSAAIPHNYGGYGGVGGQHGGWYNGGWGGTAGGPGWGYNFGPNLGGTGSSGIVR
jgi:hypothetical protein